MRFIVSFQDSDVKGLLVFTADDIKDAYQFIRENTTLNTSAPTQFTGDVDELYEILSLKRRENKKD